MPPRKPCPRLPHPSSPLLPLDCRPLPPPLQVERRLFKDAPEKALPQAVCDDLVDVIMVQVGEGGRERGGGSPACSFFVGEGGGIEDTAHRLVG